MKEIWKYPITLDSLQHIAMPAGAQVLCCQMQGENPCLWALVDPSRRRMERSVVVVGTDHPVPEIVTAQLYVGTVQLYGGALVWHVFVSPAWFGREPSLGEEEIRALPPELLERPR